jgi:hypothetical protein
VNWGKDHVILAEYVRETLVSSGLFDESAVKEIEHDTNRLLQFNHPETTGEPYDRLTDRIVEWSVAHPNPVSRQHNPDLLH